MTRGGTAGRRDGGRVRWAKRSKLALRGAALACVLGAAVPPSRLSAQSSPRLLEAVRLAQSGRSDSAHAIVARMLANTAPTDSLYPEVLFTSGMVANNLDEMQRAFQRVVVEHSTSRWADVALYRLAQIAYVRNDYPGATRQLERIRSDYPASPLLPRAAYYAADIYLKRRKDPAAACRWVTEGLARVGTDTEAKGNLLRMQDEACKAGPTDSAPAVAAAPAAPAPPPRSDSTAAPAVPPSSPSADYQVQVAAMATPAQAAEVVERLKRAGFDALVVPEKGFYKVRVGGYATSAEAAAGVQAIKAKLGGSPFVVRP
ncbi:MAG TPA: SPOR domain-containing protein [Gemmatimonadales bacterium]|nr:SPOR domain-containing protein [Gemmatimonadales bacterium]